MSRPSRRSRNCGLANRSGVLFQLIDGIVCGLRRKRPELGDSIPIPRLRGGALDPSEAGLKVTDAPFVLPILLAQFLFLALFLLAMIPLIRKCLARELGFLDIRTPL